MLATVGLDRRVAGQLKLAIGEGLVGTIAARSSCCGWRRRASIRRSTTFRRAAKKPSRRSSAFPSCTWAARWGCWWSRTERASSTTRTRPSSTRSPPSSPAACCAGRRAGVAAGRGRCRAARRRPARRAGRRRGQAAPRHQRACAGCDRRAGHRPEHELERLRERCAARSPVSSTRQQLAASVAGDVLDVFDFYKLMLDGDDKLVAAAELDPSRPSAAGALWGAVEECANLFAALDDPYFEPAPRTFTISATRSFVRSRVTAPR